MPPTTQTYKMIMNTENQKPTTEASDAALTASPGSEFRTEILGNWENPTEGVHAALRGEVPATRAMVKFCNEAAHDAEAYGDFDLARENRRDADRLKEIIHSQNVERRDGANE